MTETSKPAEKPVATKPPAKPVAKKSTATKPAAAKPEAKKARPTVTVKGPEKGRRRVGRSFGADQVTIPLSDLKPGQLEALEGDPELVVVVSGRDE